MGKYLIEFYELPDGNKPAKDFIKDLAPKMKAKVIRNIDLLESNGPMLREPISKSLGDGLFELRNVVGSDITRIIYFFRKNKVVILTNGFVKKHQKTPRLEIQLARKYKADYERRFGNEK